MSPEDRKESERRQAAIFAAHALALAKRPNGRALLQEAARHIAGMFAALDEMAHLAELEEDDRRTAVTERTRRLA